MTLPGEQSHQCRPRHEPDEEQASTDAMLAACLDVVVVTDLATETEVWSSRSLCTAFDLHSSGPEPAKPPRLADMVPGEDAKRLRAANDRLADLPDGQSISTRFRLTGSDGGTRSILRSAAPFDRDEDGVVRQALCVLRDVSENVTSGQRPHGGESNDPLTGLPGRVWVMEAVASAIEARDSKRVLDEEAPADLVLLFCDVDGFRYVNDTYGHSAGDALLIELAGRFRRALREGEVVGRVGGDEFVVLLSRAPGAGRRVTEHLRRDLTRPVIYDGTELMVSMSVGLKVVPGSDTPERALLDAEAAMHRAKLNGKNRVELFDDALQVTGAQRRRTEMALATALSSESTTTAELGVVFQPVYELTPHRLRGFEALARLTGLDGEPIVPDDFIPVAEETGMINQLSELVLDRALGALARWQLEHHDSGRTTMAVNVSARHAQHADLPRLLDEALSRHGLHPEDLVIELTESSLLESNPSTLRKLVELHDRGVGIAIDDFGTGYAGLEYLATLPVDTIKVDKSFTHGLGSDHTSTAILGAIAALALELGKSCIIEGIETQAQLESLPAGVLGQGYLLGRPTAQLVGTGDRLPASPTTT